ncbi:MAG: formate/nitrite transporter family protein [Clostridiales bacterium]|nr:formate/nitrite transporter family protein [Clostridiales bacterium]
MQDNLYTPREILQKYIKLCVNKVSYPIWKVLLLGVMAGAFISIGAAASSVSMYGIDNVGVARTVGGAVFPIGLMLIILIGGELFTGNCLVIFGILDKKYSWPTMAKNLFLVFISNLAGAVLMAILVTYSGQFSYSHDALGAYVIKVALTKATIQPGTAFISAILCNIIVCAAVFMAAGAKDLAGKILGIFFPIFVFVICGFEHCVANMYYISAGIFALGNKNYAAKAMELYGYTEAQLSSLNWTNMFVTNLLPVTIGNIVGGALFIGVPVYFAYREKAHNEQEASNERRIPLKEVKDGFSA